MNNADLMEGSGHKQVQDQARIGMEVIRSKTMIVETTIIESLFLVAREIAAHEKTPSQQTQEQLMKLLQDFEKPLPGLKELSAEKKEPDLKEEPLPNSSNPSQN